MSQGKERGRSGTLRVAWSSGSRRPSSGIQPQRSLFATRKESQPPRHSSLKTSMSSGRLLAPAQESAPMPRSSSQGRGSSDTTWVEGSKPSKERPKVAPVSMEYNPDSIVTVQMCQVATSPEARSKLVQALARPMKTFKFAPLSDLWGEGARLRWIDKALKLTSLHWPEPCRFLTEVFISERKWDPDRRGHLVRQAVRLLGAGETGVALLVAELPSTERSKSVGEAAWDRRVLKIGFIGTEEVRLQNKFAELGLAPHILTTVFPSMVRLLDDSTGLQRWVRTTESSIEMERVDIMLVDWMKDYRRTAKDIQAARDQFMLLLDVMQAHGLSHGDTHSGNVAMIHDLAEDKKTAVLKVQLIDFGLASDRGHMRVLEYLLQVYGMLYAESINYTKMMEKVVEALYTERNELIKMLEAFPQRARSAGSTDEPEVFSGKLSQFQFSGKLPRIQRLEREIERASRAPPRLKLFARHWKAYFWTLAWSQFPKFMALAFLDGREAVLDGESMGSLIVTVRDYLRPIIYDQMEKVHLNGGSASKIITDEAMAENLSYAIKARTEAESR